MNLFTVIHLLTTQLQQRTHSHGGDDSTSAARTGTGTTDASATGLQRVAERADQAEATERETNTDEDEHENARERIFPADHQSTESAVEVTQARYDREWGLMFHDEDLPTDRWVFAGDDTLVNTKVVR